ncbi:MAG: 1-acyl-sn-glycerol-3-phosphate acyltransferase [Bacilli bacterium]|nr:1-acyl-sn-glycerol-3-phosphate acyltransferase [Bacilli bacterium]
MAKNKKYPEITPDLPFQRTWLIFEIVIWIIALINKIKNRAKIVKRNKIPKPPYILISTHASMLDFYMALMLTFPHRVYWISTVEEFIPRFFIFRRIGVLAKRKFTNDPKAAMRYLEVLQKKKILVIYPEARYSFMGETERFDKGLGKMAKMANVPVVLIREHGNYLYCPQWSDHKVRKVRPIVDEVETIISRNDLEVMNADEIQAKIEENFVNSEEDWMRRKHILIKYNNRAVGLERILYKCPHCGTEFEMSSNTHFIKCNHCGVTYDYLENGQLQRVDGESKFHYPSEWYKWEKECVKEEVLKGTYHFEDDVRVERLMGAGIGFVPQEGHYHLTHDIDEGFVVKGTDNGFEFRRSSLQSYALHIEYNYLDRGAFLELADLKDTYFIYPLNKPQQLTKLHFAVEHIYDFKKAQIK